MSDEHAGGSVLQKTPRRKPISKKKKERHARPERTLSDRGWKVIFVVFSLVMTAFFGFVGYRVDKFISRVEANILEDALFHHSVFQAALDLSNDNNEGAKSALEVYRSFKTQLSSSQAQLSPLELAGFTERAPRIVVEKTTRPHIVIIGDHFENEVDFESLLDELLRDKSKYQFTAAKDPQWHPRYPQILFSGQLEREQDYELFVVDLLVGEITRLTYNNVDDHEAKWSPDGSAIVFSRRDKRQKHREGTLYVQDVWLRTVDFRKTIKGKETREKPGRNLFKVAGDGIDPAYPYPLNEFPTFATNKWVMFTAALSKNEFRLFLRELDEEGKPVSRYHVLLGDRSGNRQCKGNWFVSERDTLVVFNEYKGTNTDPSKTPAAIYIARVSFHNGSPTRPFSVREDPDVVVDGRTKNYAPDFAGSPNSIIFSSSTVGTQLAKLKLAKKVAEGWTIRTIRQSESSSYKFADWRPMLDPSVMRDYLELLE